MSAQPTLSNTPLWAITSYFNPMRYQRRLANYRLFRSHLRLPLVAVEISLGGDFELVDDEADILLRLRGGDVMWQKERLLNVALAALPPSCRKVVWLDCDLLVGDDNWPQRLSRTLDQVPVVQPYSRVYHLRRDTAANNLLNPDSAEFWQPSFVQSTGTGAEPSFDRLRVGFERTAAACAMGFAWAARRELLDEHGLYDACIVGGGDSAYACAAYGCFDEVINRHQMNDRQRAYYLAWAEPFHHAVRAAATYVDTPFFHLWHGDLCNRRALERHAGLRPFQYDPACDVAIAPSGAWRWNSDKPDLHRYVDAYFVSRQEDG